ncbi:MAG: YihY/virulence factor BrkB family protein [Roseofilum sp. SBFL]|uniref:YihY/virulence factor BrkB family protein n=1 Tax=unclassified Roseofilum TaxID=2620099 RepID=UPI001B11B98C|nr:MULTISPECIES: YihY/virulence factor BrkB family protein [unclassified Roseofilum]MBP0015392.1 YihY/virulence factor BrkB family protein [Roseofilum sp. SID3]MBP0023394.1 YihY/virulence factor BrkB family protein [Roseofilum sp. SID2]MBP0038119.1 YihY/virulence factor BrkB family protein [Roseofilum sp. SID1]MBP0044332.1 YihY/virulence factor BrkB family protein [Roseofilum sp. SBFL]
MKLYAIWRLLKETFVQWRQDRVPILAAALAYYMVFSLAPTLIIAVAVASFAIGKEAAQEQLAIQLQQFIGSEAAQSIQTLIRERYQPQSGLMATVVAIATLFFGATTVFAQLKVALNIIWGVTPKPERGFLNFLMARVLSVLMIIAIGFLLLVSLVFSSVLAGVSEWLDQWMDTPANVWRSTELLVSFIVVTLLFGAIYKILPDAKVSWADVWVGSTLTSILFTLGKWGISLYLGHSSVKSFYGAAGSFVVLLLWIFFTAQILLIGAEFTQVWANRYGTTIRPRRHAIHTGERSWSHPQTSPSPSEPLEQQRKKRKRIVQLKRFIRRVENSLHHQDDQV